MPLTAACLQPWQYLGRNILTCMTLTAVSLPPWQYSGRNLLTCMSLLQYLSQYLLIFIIMVLNLITADMATIGQESPCLFIMVVLTIITATPWQYLDRIFFVFL